MVYNTSYSERIDVDGLLYSYVKIICRKILKV